MPMSPRLLRPILSGDPDALRYIAAVQQADQQSLEPAVRKAINDFVIGCKRDGIWDAIKASCILMGARTLSGALTPLKGGAPTNVNNNFVSGDYDRKTGLVGNGSTKRINTNRLGTAEPQNSKHVSVYVSTVATSGNNQFPIYIGTPSVPATNLFREPSNGDLGFRCGTTTADSFAAGGATGFIGLNRSAASGFLLRVSNSNQTLTRTSEAVAANQAFILFGNDTAGNSNARMAYYSIGESLDLALLDTRVSALFTAIGAAI
jgi:hypothetical protein